MDKKQDIVDAAQKLFGQFGVRKTTIEEIAAEASASKVTIYKYWKNKQEIFREVVMIEAELLFDAVQEAVLKEQSAAGKLRAHLTTKLGTIRKLANLYRVTRDSMNGNWPWFEEVATFFVKKETAMLAGILKSGNQTGELNVKKVDQTAYVMAAALKSLEVLWAADGQEQSLENYVDLLLDVMLNGLKRH